MIQTKVKTISAIGISVVISLFVLFFTFIGNINKPEPEIVN